MQTNILKAILNLVQNPIANIKQHYSGINRANSMGEALEYYIKDLFCGCNDEINEKVKNEAYNKNFSYLGNLNNPPDIIIRGGDAIEVKKIKGLRSGIALNSSYPKSKLYSNSPMITQTCRDCEEWDIKDIIYVMGVTPRDVKLKLLWLIYGDCYAADKETYEKIREKIISNMAALPDTELSNTKELGRINKVDPLGITFLRIRGMWQIENPIKVFSYLEEITPPSEGLSINVIMKKDKYLSFPKRDKEKLESLNIVGLTISDVMIKSPNNPAVLEQAKLIIFRS